MRTYVFEDIDIGGGWRAMIAVGERSGGGFEATYFMAYDEAHEYACRSENRVMAEIVDKWVRSNGSSIPTLHAEQMKKIRGRRALVKAVEGFDPVIGAQTRDVALRAVVDENRRPLTVQQLAAKLFPEIVGDGTNNDSPDADWRDGDRH